MVAMTYQSPENGRTLMLSLLAAMLLLFGFSSTSQAQKMTNAQARKTFRQATRRADMGQHQKAAELFRQVLAVQDVPPVQYNLAYSLVELGDFAEADELLEKVILDRTTPSELKANAHHLREEMEKAGGWLTVRVKGPKKDVFVLLDGRELPPERIGQALRVSAREHQVSIERDEEELGRESIQIGRGASERVIFRVKPRVDPNINPVDVARAAPIDEETLALDEPKIEEDEGPNWWIWGSVIGAVVVAGTVTAIILASQPDDPVPVHSGDFQKPILTWDSM